MAVGWWWGVILTRGRRWGTSRCPTGRVGRPWGVEPTSRVGFAGGRGGGNRGRHLGVLKCGFTLGTINFRFN